MGNWKKWTVADWNVRLFEHLFALRDESAPVRHVSATSEDLRKITGDLEADPREVERHFLRALRVDPGRLEELLSVKSPECKRADAAPVPEYLAYLVLTCHVALGGEEGIINEGRFRERLRLTFHYPRGTYFYLKSLNALWRRFQTWLDERADRGECRRLVLPDPGHRTLIGYSFELAFPSLRDRRRLAELLGDQHEGAPHAREVIKRVRKHRDDFGDRFKRVFDDFRSSYELGDPKLRSHPFWSAVLDAVATEYERKSRSRRVRFDLYVPDPSASEPSFHVGSSLALDAAGLPSDVSLLPCQIEGVDSTVVLRSRDERQRPSAHAASAQLLAGTLQTRWKVLRGSRLASVVRQGVLLFCRNDEGWPIVQYARPDPGQDVWVMVRNDRLRTFLLWMFESKEDRPDDRPSPYSGWSWLGRIDSEHLQRCPSGLSDVTCLHPTVGGPALWLVGGVRSGPGFLGLSRALPRVRAPAATSVRATALQGGVELQLRREGKSFAFPERLIEGDHVITALEGDEELGRLRTLFVGGHVGIGYKPPPDSQRWEVESADVESLPWLDASATTEEGARFPHGSVGRDARRTEGRYTWEHVFSANAPSNIVPEEALDACHDFAEVAAARATRKAGLSEQEFLALLRDILNVPEGRSLWCTARAWTESGDFNRLSTRSWGSGTYFAVPPRLVTWHDGRGPVATLMGLTPYTDRERIQTKAEFLGLHVSEAASLCPWTRPMLSFRAPDADAFSELSESAELPPPAALRPLDEFVAPLAGVIETSELSAPGSHEPRGVWNWEGGYFVGPDAHGPDPSAVMLEWLDHPRAPSWYRVCWDGKQRCFRSRNWALLAALVLRGEAPYATDEEDRLVRVVPTQVFLPLPIARAAACVGGVMPGPCKLEDGSRSYVYGGGARLVRSLSAAANTTAATPSEAVALARFILLRTRSATAPRVQIPAHVADALRRRERDPVIAMLLRTRLPVDLVPSVVKLATILESR